MNIKFCITCTALTKKNFWCAYCEEKIFTAARTNSFNRKLPFLNHYLIEWNSENGRFCSASSRQMKYRNSIIEMNDIAKLLTYNFLNHINKYKNENTNDTEFILIPAPSKVDLIDHACSLAIALENAGLGSVKLALKRTEFSSQKDKSLHERRSSAAIIKKTDLEFIAKNAHIIFVDDIITTGMTALSAYIALDKPSKFSVLTIFSRALLPLSMNSDIT